MTKYAIVNQDTCIACETCSSIAPEIFAHNEGGFSFVLLDENDGTMAIPEEYHDDLEDAEESCPSGSIKVGSCPFSKKLV